MKFTTPTKSYKHLLAVIVFGAASLSVQAADNPKPSSWRNIDIKITETYGNNQSRPLRGAKVTIDLENAGQSKDYKTRFPQTKTAGARGATFTRMPPSSMVGKYVVTVLPKTGSQANKYTCKEKTKTFIHGGPKTTQQFNFKCRRASSGSSSTATVTLSSNEETVGDCHRVRITKQEGRKRPNTSAKACLKADGNYEIVSFSY